MAMFLNSWECPKCRLEFVDASVNRQGLKYWRFECNNAREYPWNYVTCVKSYVILANMWAPKLLGQEGMSIEEVQRRRSRNYARNS